MNRDRHVISRQDSGRFETDVAVNWKTCDMKNENIDSSDSDLFFETKTLGSVIRESLISRSVTKVDLLNDPSLLQVPSPLKQISP